ncbi:MAG: LuxR family transcriptional regulator [Rhodospirillales bacterium]|nr:LuxR family transcriptional regulator [Rhodospirillales bacterium]
MIPDNTNKPGSANTKEVIVASAPSYETEALRVTDFIDRCDQATAPQGVFDAFRHAAGHFGYHRIALVAVTAAAQQALGLAELSPVITANVPEEWIRHYRANSYEVYDPVLLQTPHEEGPLVWDDLLRGVQLSPKQRRVLIESRDAGLFNGVSIPLHGPRGETYVTSLATEHAAAMHRANLAKLQLVAIQFMISYSRTVRRDTERPASVHITDRERECLTWTARGKSAWSIGKILGLSEHTVNFHLKRSMVKLDATNRMQAVVAAVRLGLILP